MGDPTRPVATQFGPDGTPYALLRMSPTDNRVRARVTAPARNVIPILFVPGIMGSNLRAKQAITDRKSGLDVKRGDAIWRIDSGFKFGLRWLGKDAATRQLLINKDVLEVDPAGQVDNLNGAESGGSTNDVLEDLEKADPLLARRLRNGLSQMAAMRADRRRRGWGTVSWEFYGQFLAWLESSLRGIAIQDGQPNAALAALLALVGSVPDGVSRKPAGLSKSAILHLLNFSFPVHACGYNWATSNLDSGQKLAQTIRDTITFYQGRNGQVCEKVIVITHSMGGLVARAAAMAHGAAGSILGVIHGVMPTHGAAAMYKRASLGFGNETDGWLDIKGVITGYALGNTAQETTPVLAYNPGPLELAPNQVYNGSKPWLFIEDGRGHTLKALPVSGNPYQEIYARTDVAWRLIHPEYLNPAGLPGSPATFLGKFLRTLSKAEDYHKQLATGGFHPNTYAHYSADTRHASWGKLRWKVQASELYIPPPNLLGGFSFPQRLNDPNRPLTDSPEHWRVKAHGGSRGLMLTDSKEQELRAEVRPKAEAGDETVPATESAGGVDAHAKIVCRHTHGYKHDGDYNDERVRRSVLDAIVRMVEPVTVK